MTYDYTLVTKNSGLSLVTTHIETEYDAKVFSKNALSDHKGLLSTISMTT